MATMNPLERKARHSFVKGMVVAGLIGVVAAAALIMVIVQMKGEEKERLESMVDVYVLSQEVKSGQIITSDMMVKKKIEGAVAPKNRIDDVSQYYLRDQNNNQIISTGVKEENGVKTPVLSVVIPDTNGNMQQYEIQNLSSDYTTGVITVNGGQQPIIIKSIPVVAKVNMTANTILTSETVVESNELTDNTTRKQEFNVLALPADIETDDIVDVRLRMPDGTDYIVVSKKTITVLDEGGIPSLNTVSMELSEAETLMMSNAIVEAYQMKGSKLYVARYVEPGIQTQATATYTPNAEVQTLIRDNPNIIQEAKNAISANFNGTNRDNITSELNKYDEDERDSAVESGTSSEISAQQDERQTYLDSLSGQ